MSIIRVRWCWGIRSRASIQLEKDRSDKLMRERMIFKLNYFFSYKYLKKKIHFIKKIPNSHVLKNFCAMLVGGLGPLCLFQLRGGDSSASFSNVKKQLKWWWLILLSCRKIPSAYGNYLPYNQKQVLPGAAIKSLSQPSRSGLQVMVRWHCPFHSHIPKELSSLKTLTFKSEHRLQLPPSHEFGLLSSFPRACALLLSHNAAQPTPAFASDTP